MTFGEHRERDCRGGCLLKITLACGYDSESDACFCESHRRAFGSIKVGAGLDDLAGERLG